MGQDSSNSHPLGVKLWRIPCLSSKARGGVSGEAMGHYVISCGYLILPFASIFEKNLSFLLKKTSPLFYNRY